MALARAREENDNQEDNERAESDQDNDIPVRAPEDVCIHPGCERERQFAYGSGLDYCCKSC